MKTKGWRNVFSFTFVQYVKTKSFIVGTILICLVTALICVLTNILPVVLSDSGDDDGEIPTANEFFEVGTVYLFDDAKLFTEDDKAELAELFKNRFSEPEKPLSDITTELKDSENAEIAVQIVAQNDKDGNIVDYEVRSFYTAAARDSVDVFNDVMSSIANRRILLNAGVAPERYPETQIGVSTMKTQAGGKSLNGIQGLVNYTLPIVLSMVLFMMIFSYGSVIASAIATEKTGRVMELLLVSVRPLAVVIGKVFAMVVVSFLQVLLIVGVGALSFAATAPFGWVSKAVDMLKDPAVKEALAQMAEMGQSGALDGVSSSELGIAQAFSDFTNMFTPVNIVLMVLIFLLGFLFFALLAALIGASVSRMEDFQAAMSPYSIIGVLGMYLSYFPVMFNVDALSSGDSATNPVQIFSYFFPISSPFALPSAVLLGTLAPWKVAAAVAVLALFVVLIAIVVGKVYEAIILHNGNRIKLGDILKMAVRK